MKGLLSDAKLLETSAWVLKSECNTQLKPPVNTLPLEILSHVFTMVAETERPLPPYDLRALGSFKVRVDDYGVAHSDREGTYGEVEEPLWLSGRGGTLGWIALGHVCILWRRLLLASSSLWAGDIGALPAALHIMLERAGNTRPLVLRLYGATYRREAHAALWTTIAANDGAIARRIRGIYWIERRLGYLEEEVFPSLALCPFLSLEMLEISAYENFGESRVAMIAPRIRVATFTNAACMFTSAALTELSIVGTVPDNSDLWTWELKDHALRTIIEAHRLTLLHLRLDVEAIDPQRPPHHEPPIDLPRLQSLTFHGTSVSLGPDTLIYRISYPRSCRTYVEIDPLVNNFGRAQDLQQLVSALQRAGSVAPFGLALEEHKSLKPYDSSVLLRFYTAPTAHAPSYGPIHVDDYAFGRDTLRLTLKIANTHMPLRTLLEALSASILMVDVRALSYFSNCMPCRATGTLILDHFPAVQTLHIVDPSPFHTADGDILSSLSQSGAAGPRMPMLERLLLSQKSKSHPLSAKSLAHQLLARYDHRTLNLVALMRLKELTIHESVIVVQEEGLDQAVMAIWGLVDSLNWQGHHVAMEML